MTALERSVAHGLADTAEVTGEIIVALGLLGLDGLHRLLRALPPEQHTGTEGHPEPGEPLPIETADALAAGRGG